MLHYDGNLWTCYFLSLSNYVSMLVLKIDCVDVSKTCSGNGWLGPEFRQHLGGCTSHARPSGTTGL
jgi:hypothetical protein